jgi:hypothetical protein
MWFITDKHKPAAPSAPTEGACQSTIYYTGGFSKCTLPVGHKEMHHYVRLAAPLPDRAQGSAYDAWAASLPKCISYSGGCDGDLVATDHEPNCPMFGKQPANLRDAFEAGRALSSQPRAQGLAELVEEARIKMLQHFTPDRQGHLKRATTAETSWFIDFENRLKAALLSSRAVGEGLLKSMDPPNPITPYRCPYCNEDGRLIDAGMVVDRYMNVCHAKCLAKESPRAVGEGK